LDKVGEVTVDLNQASVIDVNADLTFGINQFQAVTCLVEIEGTQVSNEVRASIAQTTNSGELEDDVASMNVVGSSIYRGSGNETYATGDHTVELWCKTTEIAAHQPAVVTNQVILAWTSAT
jgi:hypothetical protein